MTLLGDLPTPPPSRQVSVQAGGAQVNVRVWSAGSASSPVLLAFHGLTDSGGEFATLWEDLGRRWSLVAPDAPGHGASAWPRSAAYDVAAQVAGAVATLDELADLLGHQPARVVLLGHSMGALTALALAARRPEAVAHLVIEEPPRRPLLPWWDRYRHRRWLRRLQALNQSGREELAAAVNDWRWADVWAWSTSKPHVDLALFDVPIRWGPPVTRLLAQVGCPTTIVLGTDARGSTTSRRREEAYRAACRAGCEIAHVDAGHNPRRDAPEAFAAVLSGVMNRYQE